MFNNPKSQWVRALVLASALSLPTVASASEDLESRLSTLETQMSELSEKVDMLAAEMEKTPPATSPASRDLKSSWMLYDSRGAKEATRLWPDFWEKDAHDSH